MRLVSLFAIKVLYDSNDKQYNTVKLIEYSSCSNGINYSTSGNSLLGYLVSTISFSRALFSSSLAHHSRAIPFQFYLFSIYYFSLGHINEQNIFPIMRQYARPYFGLFNFAQIKRKWHFYSFFSSNHRLAARSPVLFPHVFSSSSSTCSCWSTMLAHICALHKILM